MRKAKGRIGSLKEDSTADEDEDEEEGVTNGNTSSDDDSEVDQLEQLAYSFCRVEAYG